MKSKRIALGAVLAATAVATGALATAASAQQTVPSETVATVPDQPDSSPANTVSERHAQHAHGKGTPAAIFFP